MSGAPPSPATPLLDPPDPEPDAAPELLVDPPELLPELPPELVPPDDPLPPLPAPLDPPEPELPELAPLDPGFHAGCPVLPQPKLAASRTQMVSGTRRRAILNLPFDATWKESRVPTQRL